MRRIRKRLADGRDRFYYYAWRGGPVFWIADDRPIDEKNPPAGFWSAREEATAEAKARPPARTISQLADQMEYTDAAYLKLAESTRATNAIYLKRIREEFGEDDILAFGVRAIREEVITWRDKYATTPRAADYGVAMLRRLISYAVEIGVLEVNHVEGIGELYDCDRADLIWSAEQIDLYMRGDPAKDIGPATPQEAAILTHARYTGLRRGDLATITKAADRKDHLSWFTAKKRRRKEAVIPIVPAYRAYLDAAYEARKAAGIASVNLIVNREGLPFTPSGLGATVNNRAKALGIERHLHDMRGTYATELMLAGFDDREIAEVLDWEEARVARIRRRYVDRSAIVKAGIRRLESARNKNGTGNQGGNQSRGV